MKQKINIAELLKGCPEGMELDCTMFDNVYFDKIFDYEDCLYQIRCYIIADGVRNSINFTKYGEFNTMGTAKCVIFPKGKTTWEGFHKPFKDGDIIADNHKNIAIYKGKMWYNCNLADYYCGYRNSDNRFLDKPKKDGHFGSIEELHLATKEEKEKLFKAIKDNGYKWNEETKTLEKLIQPNFKVGDEIKYKYPTTDTSTLTIIKVEYDKNRYVVCDKHNNFAFLSFFAQDNFNLIRKTKFDTSTLVPFDSRVLVRDNDYDVWRVAFWGYLREKQDIKYDTTRGVYRQCIPYEGNEHLLGKTDDCDEYYKTWL